MARSSEVQRQLAAQAQESAEARDAAAAIAAVREASLLNALQDADEISEMVRSRLANAETAAADVEIRERIDALVNEVYSGREQALDVIQQCHLLVVDWQGAYEVALASEKARLDAAYEERVRVHTESATLAAEATAAAAAKEEMAAATARARQEAEAEWQHKLQHAVVQAVLLSREAEGGDWSRQAAKSKEGSNSTNRTCSISRPSRRSSSLWSDHVPRSTSRLFSTQPLTTSRLSPESHRTAASFPQVSTPPRMLAKTPSSSLANDTDSLSRVAFSTSHRAVASSVTPVQAMHAREQQRRTPNAWTHVDVAYEAEAASALACGDAHAEHAAGTSVNGSSRQARLCKRTSATEVRVAGRVKRSASAEVNQKRSEQEARANACAMGSLEV